MDTPDEDATEVHHALLVQQAEAQARATKCYHTGWAWRRPHQTLSDDAQDEVGPVEARLW
jgi:hypothetical protein